MPRNHYVPTLDSDFVATFMYFLISLSLYFKALVGDFTSLFALLH